MRDDEVFGAHGTAASKIVMIDRFNPLRFLQSLRGEGRVPLNGIGAVSEDDGTSLGIVVGINNFCEPVGDLEQARRMAKSA